MGDEKTDETDDLWGSVKDAMDEWDLATLKARVNTLTIALGGACEVLETFCRHAVMMNGKPYVNIHDVGQLANLVRAMRVAYEGGELD